MTWIGEFSNMGNLIIPGWSYPGTLSELSFDLDDVGSDVVTITIVLTIT